MYQPWRSRRNSSPVRAFEALSSAFHLRARGRSLSVSGGLSIGASNGSLRFGLQWTRIAEPDVAGRGRPILLPAGPPP